MDNLNSKPQIEIRERFKKMNEYFTKIMNNLIQDDFNKIDENENLTNELLNNFKNKNKIKWDVNVTIKKKKKKMN